MLVLTKSSGELMQELASPNSKFTMVGTISLSDSSARDPFSDDSLKLVRPRACALGGDAVGLWVAMSMSNGGSGTTYAVFARKGNAAPEATAPTM